MSYYYKADEQKSFEILRLIHKMHKHETAVLDWLKSKFEMPEDGTFNVFDEVPDFTDDILRDNPHLKTLVNKTNNRLNKRNKESKELISDWQEYKKQQGLSVKGSYPRMSYVFTLRDLFRYGSISPLFDKENQVVYFKTSEQSNHEALEEITMKEYNLKEIELDESEEK